VSLEHGKALVVGVGEVGGALAEVLERKQPVLRHDVKPQKFKDPIAVMHLCFPYQSRERFEADAAAYIDRFRPELTVVNSTVMPGTVRAIARRTGARIAYSPVRGKHARMVQELLRYTKFVAAAEPETARNAEEHFQTAGMTTRRFNDIESLELAKLAETTYFGVLIAFAQELNRLADKVGADYLEVIEFFREIDFLPSSRYFPGFIGGHCVIPNIKLLKKVARSPLFEAVLESNRRRAAELAGGESGSAALHGNARSAGGAESLDGDAPVEAKHASDHQ
jgi:UDP-glucose/GDP-mannose dehydrogenase family, central domain